ncbi:glycosyltransferase family 8 protein [Mesorhizobium sp. UC22_110]|uniref:glycosyltransferase family 8 protein n=1 Tax=unclassified Mesorhizobium TaxID=325217 RepID=UPI00366EDE9A
MAKACYFFAADATYFPHAVVAARRAMSLSSSLHGFILTTRIPNQDIEVARGLLGNAVQIIDVSAYVEDLNVNTFRLGIATYLRLFADVLPELQPFDRAIYLDCDVLVNQDLATLAKTEMIAPLVAAHDDQRYFDDEFRKRLSMPAGAPYFNAGVMLLDLDTIRRERLFEKTRSFAEEHRNICKQHDQDALNIVFMNRWQTLHPKWNAMTNFSGHIHYADAYIRHFSWGKPWWKRPLGVEQPAMDEYYKLTGDTPWAAMYLGRSDHWGFLMKRLGRSFDPLLGFFGDKRAKRRAPYNAFNAQQAQIADADALLLARWFPERTWKLDPPYM